LSNVQYRTPDDGQRGFSILTLLGNGHQKPT